MNSEETLYEAYPESKSASSRTYPHITSNNEVIVKSLNTVYKKMKGLEGEKGRVTLGQTLTQNRAQNPDDLPSVHLSWIEKECEAAVQNVLEILRVTHLGDPTDTELLPKSAKKKTAAPNNTSKLKEPNASPRKCHTEGGARHYRLDLKRLPFVPSKVCGPTASLPANIQNLIAALKSHTPLLCSLPSEANAADHILMLERKLEDVIALTQECIGKPRIPKQLSTSPCLQKEYQRNALITSLQRIQKLKHHFQPFMEKPVTGSSSPPASSNLKEAKSDRKGFVVRRKPKMSFSQYRREMLGSKVAKSGFINVTSKSKVPMVKSACIGVSESREQNLASHHYMNLLLFALKRNGFRLSKAKDD